MIPLVEYIIDYENGTLDSDQILDLFAELIRTGAAWRYQGSYGRTAHSLIQNGFISETGEVLQRP